MITEDYKSLSPAYGRDYKSKAAIEADFIAGKDFILNDIMSPWYGKPISIRDFKVGVKVELRYAQLTELTIVTVPEPQKK